jgi:hypothetical protein
MIASLMLTMAVTGNPHIGPYRYYPPTYQSRPAVYRDGRWYRVNPGVVDGRSRYGGQRSRYYAPSYRSKPRVYRDGRNYRRPPLYIDGRRVR